MDDAPLRWIETQREAMTRLLCDWSAINSGSRNLPGLARMGDAVRAAFASLGGATHVAALEPEQVIDASGNVVASPLGQLISIVKRPDAPLRVLLNIHYDTVFGPEHPFRHVSRVDDDTLVAHGAYFEGRSLVKQARVRDGMALLDEAMLAALSDQLKPMWTGAIYCGLLDACHELDDLRRAKEWTEAAEQWCAPMPMASLYPGICRVHSAEILGLQGAWEQAEADADDVFRLDHHAQEVVEAGRRGLHDEGVGQRRELDDLGAGLRLPGHEHRLAFGIETDMARLPQRGFREGDLLRRLQQVDAAGRQRFVRRHRGDLLGRGPLQRGKFD